LYLWRWLSTLAAFGVSWLAARRMGARGFVPLVIVMLCVMVYRGRAQARPETLVAVLLALEIWVLEARRHPRPVVDESQPSATPAPRYPSPWIVAIAWVWANVHISYWMGLALAAIHLVGSPPAATRRAAGTTRPLATRTRLAGVLLASALISFANPFGWRALAQPFEYWFVWRHELVYKVISELGPLDWSV